MPRRPAPKRVTTDTGTKVYGKHANGTGSVYWDASKDSYRATWRDPVTGRTRRTSGRTKAEATERRDAAVAAAASSQPTGRLGRSPTVGELAGYWLDEVAAPRVRPSTMHTYRKDAGRIVEHLGATLTADLDVEAVRRFLAGMRRAGLGVGTIRNARTRLRQVAQEAVELGYLAANPVPSVPTPTASAEDRKARRWLDAAETRRLVLACTDLRLGAAVAMLFTSGSRASEVLGLAWSDIDLGAGTATVRRACTYTGGGIGPRLDQPKTAGTAGVHHLAPSVVELLVARRAAQDIERAAAGTAWETVTYEGQSTDLVFTTAAGGLVLRQSLYASVQAAAGRAGIDPAGIGTHTGRRSTVTNLYVAGLSLDDIAGHVGHGSTGTTTGYVVDLGQRPRDTARAAARLLDPATDADADA